MTTAESAGHIANDPCPEHDAQLPHMGPRDVDAQTFRNACVDLLNRLNDIGPSEEEVAEKSRQSLMRTIAGAYAETRCDQTMILTF